MSIVNRGIAPIRRSEDEVPNLTEAAQRRAAFTSFEAIRKSGLLPEPEQERLVADQFRRIKRPILQRLIASNGDQHTQAQICMVTSALPGDGKTFTSMNLALNIARERDHSVLLVDGDVVKSRLTHLLELENRRGLVDALVDKYLDVESLTLSLDVPGLSILPAGRKEDSSTELISSARMLEVVARLTLDPRRIVLFDSGPLLMSSEARALGHIAGQVIVVVRAGGTPQRAVEDAIAQLGEGRLSGLVLNHSREMGRDFDGYDGYGG
jgi:protein-tyrosine kinase